MSINQRLPDVTEDIFSLPATLFVSRWILEKTPFVFGADQYAYIQWKHALGLKLHVDPRAIVVVGSAACGVSLSPAKALRAFSRTSDIDVAVVSMYHFNLVWNWLRDLGSERYGFPEDVKRWIDDHRKRLIYWGVIATDRILPYTPLAPAWVEALSEMSRIAPVQGREINVRLFMDFASLRAYQVSGIRKIQQSRTT